MRALLLLLERGEPGEAYNIQADNHRPNIDVARAILDLLDKPYDLIRFVEDRAGHDPCYYMDCDQARVRSAGSRSCDFDAAIEDTVRWYAENRAWWERARDADFERFYERQYGSRLARCAGLRRLTAPGVLRAATLALR